MASDLKVIHLIPADGLGGVEIAARSAVENCRPGFDFKVVLISGPPLKGPHSRVLTSHFRSLNNPLAHLKVLKTILSERPDILVCSLWRSVPASVLAKILRPNMRLVSFIHSANFSNRMDKSLHSIIGYFADQTWTDSKATLNARVAKERQSGARVISFVVDRMSPLSEPTAFSPHFVSWGSMKHAKGVDRAIRLIAQLVERGVDARYDAWGPGGAEQASLERLRDELGLSSRVTFNGAVQRGELPRIAESKSFYLQLSRREGMAMSVVEAMQLGLIPVVTAVGEMATYCENGVNALICDPDNLDAVADTITDKLSNASSLLHLRRNAQAYWRDNPLYPESFFAAAQELQTQSSPEQP